MSAPPGNHDERELDTAAPDPGQRADEVTLSLHDLLHQVWRGKWYALVTAAVALALAMLSTGMREPTYVAGTLIRPLAGNKLLLSESPTRGRAAPTVLFVPRLRDLFAETERARYSSEALVRFDKLVAKLDTVDLARRLLERPFVAREVAAEGGGAGRQAGAGGEDGERPEGLSSFVAWLTRTPARMPPVHAVQGLLKNVWIKRDEATGLQLVTFRHSDPDFTARFLQAVLDESDNIIREQERAALDQQMLYLERRRREIEAVDYQHTLGELIAKTELKRLLFDATTPYSYEVARSIVAPAPQDVPPLDLILTLALVGGSALGLFVSVLVHARDRPSPGAAPLSPSRNEQ